jgi:hypothetical protein
MAMAASKGSTNKQARRLWENKPTVPPGLLLLQNFQQRFLSPDVHQVTGVSLFDCG